MTPDSEPYRRPFISEIFVMSDNFCRKADWVSMHLIFFHTVFLELRWVVVVSYWLARSSAIVFAFPLQCLTRVLCFACRFYQPSSSITRTSYIAFSTAAMPYFFSLSLCFSSSTVWRCFLRYAVASSTTTALRPPHRASTSTLTHHKYTSHELVCSRRQSCWW